MKSTDLRNEIKYLCSEAELSLIKNRLKEICQPDVHAGADGTYLVSSLYFDDYDNDCYFANENGTDPKSKFRIRIYNRDLKHIVMECKHRYRGLTRKESCILDREDLERLLEHGSLGPREPKDPLMSRFYMLWHMKALRPKIIVEYERTAFTYSVGNVRITFDKNIAASVQVAEFGQSLSCRPIMSSGRHILEMKYDTVLPGFIYNAAGIENLSQVAFSKYYLCRRAVNC